ncbi:hypothetical protein [Roseateles sp.]|uniref:hypothetical protein n=1 Tax=Roseateles sp. TaxID=1971397 RepID=UPI00326443DE
MPDSADPDDDQSPDWVRQLSNRLMSQIDARIQQAVMAAGPPPQYYVIRSESTGVLSVIAACSLGDEQEPIGPLRSFADCIAYVNAQMVGREAAGEPPLVKPPHPKHPKPPHPKPPPPKDRK